MRNQDPDASKPHRHWDIYQNFPGSTRHDLALAASGQKEMLLTSDVRVVDGRMRTSAMGQSI
jgi:hypothetical protein